MKRALRLAGVRRGCPDTRECWRSTGRLQEVLSRGGARLMQTIRDYRPREPAAGDRLRGRLPADALTGRPPVGDRSAGTASRAPCARPRTGLVYGGGRQQSREA